MVGITSKLALKRRGSPSCTCRSVTRGCETGVSPSLSVSLRKYRGTRASTTSLLMPSAKRCLITEAGAWPVRKPGMRASFWYFWIRVSVSRATSSAGISTWISRFVLLLVSVGLTFAFRCVSLRVGVVPIWSAPKPPAYSLSVKTEGEHRQTPERIFLCYFGTLVTGRDHGVAALLPARCSGSERTGFFVRRVSCARL